MSGSPSFSPKTGAAQQPPPAPAPAAGDPNQPSPLSQPTAAAIDSAGEAAGVPTHVIPSLGSTTLARPTLDDRRRPSVQFLPHVRGLGSRDGRSGSRKPIKEIAGRRLSSPPPPTQFQPRVSFDTFDNRDASDFSLTLNRKHKYYAYSKRSRTFLCGTDTNDYSDTALEWLIDELVDDGDEIVCLRVVEKDSKEAIKWAGTGVSRERGYRAEAERMLERIEGKNTEDKAINLVLEFSIGKVQDTIQHMIRIYEPAILVVGTRGRSLGGFQGLLPGSVSKYCLQHSPVPVIVVRPSSKRDKKKKKRLRDPSRRGYRDILDKSEDVGEAGGHLLDERHRMSIMGGLGTDELGRRDAEEEARMVAEAVGYRSNPNRGSEGAPLAKTLSNVSAASTRSRRSMSMGSVGSDFDDPKSPLQLMKSPELRDLDSPMASDYESDSDDFPEVPEHMKAQEEALQKARERAVKAEEEVEELEKERERKAKEREERLRALRENRKPNLPARDRTSSPSSRYLQTGDDELQGGLGALALLDQLDKPKGRKR